MTPERPGRPPRRDFIPLAEAAELIGVSTRTVERMMDRGQLQFRRTPGGTRRLYRSSVEQYLATNLDSHDSNG